MNGMAVGRFCLSKAFRVDFPSSSLTTPLRRRVKYHRRAMELDNGQPTNPSSNRAEETKFTVAVDDKIPGKVLQLRLPTHGDPPIDFCNFVESFPKHHVIGFFRQVIHEVEVRRKILDFHLRVRHGANPGFVIDIIYGDRFDGPYDVAPGSLCISCHRDARLYPYGDVSAGECVLGEFGDQPYVQCCLDAKARPGFIVTPLRHVDRMSDLDNEEIYQLWRVGVRAVRSEGFDFIRMVLNHGCYRNVAHLHLKVWVDPEAHARAREKWPPSRIVLWNRLHHLATLLPAWGKAQMLQASS